MAFNLNITLIQSELAWEDRTTNLSRFEEKIRGLGPGAEVVVLPEMFSTGFSMQPGRLAETMDGETVGWMKRVSAENRIILTGSVIIKENDQYFNRLLWVLPDGQLGIYDKKHLFAYAGEDQFYTAGNKRLIASVKGWKINLQVCYDLRFPVWARQQMLEEPEYDVLIYVANWPQKRNTAWKTLLRARAIENQCYVVGVNRVGVDGNGIDHSGDSMVIDPLGEILYESEGVESIVTITLQKETLLAIREKLPFLGDSDHFLLVQ
ncbi:MAG: amidohydrolase [Chitinophagaceae bacterium]